MKRFYIHSCAWILLIVGLAKILNTWGGPNALAAHDPIFGLAYGKLMILAAVAEISLAVFCFYRKKSEELCLLLISMFGTALFAYRLGLWIVNWKAPCSCLGSLTGGLGISTGLADLIAKIILAYLVVGGYWLMLKSEKAHQAS